MAACIICNQRTMPDDLEDVGDMAKLHDRLEKVLNETVPVDVVMCASCQFDLAQIEIYYALLMVFKKRYSETAKQRLPVCEGDISKNLFNQTATCSSDNLQTIFGAGNSSESSATQFPSHSDIEGGSPDNSTAVGNLELINVRTVREELQVETSRNNTGETLHETLQPIAFPIWSPAPKKCGRPRKNEKSNSASSPGIPRKNEQNSPVQSDISMSSKKQRRSQKGEASNVRGLKKRGRPKKNKPSSSVVTEGSAVYAKKRGRPRKSGSSNNSSSMGTLGPADLDWEESAPKISVDREYEITDLVQVKAEVDEHTLDPTPGEEESSGRKDQDTSYVPETYITEGRRKPGRPKKTEQRPQPPFTCPKCNKVFIDRARLRVHMKCHNEERPFVCSLCGKGFKDNSNLGGHMKIHTAEKAFKCEVCGKAFLRRIALDRHSLVHSDARPVPCDQCEAWFKSQEELKTHIKFKHVQGRKFLCNICGLGLYKESSLRTHMISHCEVKPFRCETCGKRFTSKQTLTNHEFSHKPEDTREKYLCPICGKEFRHKYYLNCHVKIHTGESKHFCSPCDRYFMKLSDYKQHMMTHTGEKPHSCSQCGKAFRQPGNLKTHMMSHTDERPFICSCGQAFRQKAKLQKHMLTKVHAAFETNSAADQTSSAPALPPSATPPPVAAPPYIIEPLAVLVPLAVSWEETGTSPQGPLNMSPQY